MWGMFGPIQVWMLELVDGLGDVIRHREVNVAVDVIPTELETAVQHSGPIDRDFIHLL
jgi:hypothetical protein